MIIIDLLRHGEPVGGKKYRGRTDDPLSKLGWEQMNEAVGGYNDWDQIISSPLLRCSAFAEQLAKKTQTPLGYEAGFMEIGFGLWEGKTVDQISVEYSQELKLFWQDPVRNTPPQAEPVSEFKGRIISTLYEKLKTAHDCHILLVTHAGVIRMLLHEVLCFPLANLFRIDVPYGSISRVQFENLETSMSPRLLFHAGKL